MKVELKGIKYAAFASKDTYCFSARVSVDGRYAGIVQNDGHGGAHRYEPRELEETLRPWADGHPGIPCAQFNGDKTIKLDVDGCLSELVSEFLSRRDMARAMKRGMLVLKTNGKLYTVKVPAGRAYLPGPDVAKILNAVPADEAFDIWKKASGA